MRIYRRGAFQASLLAGLVCLAAPAMAQEWAGTYELVGEHEHRGRFTSTLTLGADGSR